MKEPWQIEHERLYGPNATPSQEGVSQEPAKRGPKNPFRVCRVSKDTDELIRAVEQAMANLSTAAANEDREQIENAYAHLCVCRESLYNHISKMELQTRVVRDVVKRF